MKQTFAGFLCLMTAACSNQDLADIRPPVADSIMTEVIIDFYLLEARTDMRKEDLAGYKDSVLAGYNISREEFEANMAYYREHPDAYHKVYSKALDEMNEERYLPPNIDSAN